MIERRVNRQEKTITKAVKLPVAIYLNKQQQPALVFEIYYSNTYL
jgi:hypothetical protein